MPFRRITAAAGAAAPLATATAPALAETLTRSDAAGRAITLDPRPAGVDVDGYARVLSESLNGDGISAVTIRIVPASAIAADCGDGAAACFERVARVATIVVPVRTASAVRDSLVHEYGHHVDSTVRHQAGPCSDGTARWWAARGAAAALASGQLRCDYSSGWDHSVAEVFAEDHRVLNVAGAVSRGALGHPGPAVLEALRQDVLALAGAIPAPPPGAPPGPVPRPEFSAPATGVPAAAGKAPVLRRGRGLGRAGRLRARGIVRITFPLTARKRGALVVGRRGAARGDLVVTLRCGRGGGPRRRRPPPRGGQCGRPGRAGAPPRSVPAARRCASARGCDYSPEPFGLPWAIRDRRSRGAPVFTASGGLPEGLIHGCDECVQ